MSRMIFGLVAMLLLCTGCAGMRQTVSVTVEVPLPAEYAGLQQRGSLKVTYGLESAKPVVTK